MQNGIEVPMNGSNVGPRPSKPEESVSLTTLKAVRNAKSTGNPQC